MDKGGRIRTYQMLKELKRDHEVVYLTLDDGSSAPDAREKALEYCHELITIPHLTRAKFSAGFYFELLQNLASRYPYFIRKYRSREMEREVLRLDRTGKFDVLVCDFLQPSINVPSGLSLPTVLFQHNVEAMIWKRHYEVQQNPVKKLFLYNQWLKAFRCERDACQRFSGVLAVSAEDRKTMREQYGVNQIADVPTGVDTEFFARDPNTPREPYNLVFTGSMDWLPNEDAIQYFIREVLPLIKREIPEVTLTVVGRNPYPSLIETAARDNSIQVTGRVDDVRPYMDRAAAYIVPIRVGGGTRLKIFEAMAMAKAVVSTTIGAEGLPVKHGEDLLIADQSTSFADAVVSVLRDRELAGKLGHNSATLVREQFSWRRAAASLADFCERVIKLERPATEGVLRQDFQNVN